MRPNVGEARLLRLVRRGARPGDDRDASRARSRVRTNQIFDCYEVRARLLELNRMRSESWARLEASDRC
jgi:hypothetical protein